MQVARDELQEELLGAARIMASSILVLRDDLIEGAQAGVHVLHSSTCYSAAILRMRIDGFLGL